MKNIIPAREQIQPLTDGLTRINYTARARSLHFLPVLMPTFSFSSFFAECRFPMSYSLPKYNRVPNVIEKHTLNFKLKNINFYNEQNLHKLFENFLLYRESQETYNNF